MPDFTSWFLDAMEAEADVTIRAGAEHKRFGTKIDEVPLLLGKVFEIARRRHGLSVDEVSRRTHLERNDLECLEKGVLNVSWESSLQQLTKALELPEKEVLCLTRPRVLRDREVSKVAKHFYDCTRTQSPTTTAMEAKALDDLLATLNAYCSRRTSELP